MLISAKPVKYLHSFWAKCLAATRCFRQVVKGGFYRRFDLVVYFTLVAFLYLFLVFLAILDSYPTYQQENAGKNISKKRDLLHVNRII